MNRTLSSFIILSGLAILAVSTVNCDCDTEGCQDRVSTTADLNVAVTSIQGGVVEICRNGQCSNANLAAGTPNGSLDVYCETAVGGHIDCRLPRGSTQFEIDYLLADTDANDGDVYTFKVTSAAGDVLFQKDATVEYEKVEPNGEACPGVCYQADV